MSEPSQFCVSVSDCIALINQTLEYAYPTVQVEGEVASFKVNKNQYVFFDIKDPTGTLGCFMTIYQLRMPLEDGMKVRVTASPRLTAWGKFSLTVRQVVPVGEGDLKRSFEILRAKLEKEGLFAPERKRSLLTMPVRIGVVTSTQAAGYADFVKILSERWGGLELVVANTQVQGADAPQQMIRALDHLNQLAEPLDVVAIVRGGGSADDLAAFNDEPLVRAIAASRTPVVVGVGHEVDTSLADMVADVRAITPSSAAQLLVPDRREVMARVEASTRRMVGSMEKRNLAMRSAADSALANMTRKLGVAYDRQNAKYRALRSVLAQLDPRLALRRGYAIARAADGSLLLGRSPRPGDTIAIETATNNIQAGVINVSKKQDN